MVLRAELMRIGSTWFSQWVCKSSALPSSPASSRDNVTNFHKQIKSRSKVLLLGLKQGSTQSISCMANGLSFFGLFVLFLHFQRVQKKIIYVYICEYTHIYTNMCVFVYVYTHVHRHSYNKNHIWFIKINSLFTIYLYTRKTVSVY